VLFRDVTSASQTRHAQRDFVTHVAHELKSPLNVIGMYSEALLGQEGESADFRIEACNTLRDEVERVSLLVGTLLTISQIDAGTVVVRRQRVRLQEFLADVLDAVSRGGKRAGLRFRLDLPHELPAVQVDKELLRVALNNLLSNAIKYNREGGEVVLSTRESEQELVVSVRDDGVGIDEGDLERVFEKFYRSEDPEVQKRGGQGLGLALVRQIAALHGAEVRVQSVPQQGSTFSIAFRKSAALLGEEAAA
jgi:two-component system sensor histidine kinase VicK